MPLRGELNSVDLAHIFQMLILNQKAGILEIVHEGVKRPLFFTPDGVHVPFETDLLMKRATRALVRSGQVTRAQVDRARCNMEAVGKDLVATMVEMKIVTPEERVRALRHQLEEEVYELFFLKDASFEFRDGELPDAHDAHQEFALSPNGLIMEAARRIDEWEFIKTLVASGGDIVETRAQLERLDARENDADAKAVCDAIDGIRTVDEVIEKTEIPRFVVFRKIALFLDAGVAAAVSVESLLERARSCLASSRVRSAVNLFERAIALGAGDVSVLAGAGQAYETLEECAPAAERYLEAGRKAEESGNLDAALKLYMRIRQLLPTQVEARERLFALRKLAAAQFGRGDYDAEQEGFELARILYELGRPEELALVLSGLLDLAADRPEDIERVSELSAKMGQVAFAVDALLRAADFRAAGKDFQGAIRLLKNAQALDSTRGDLAERIQQLGDSARVRRRRRRSTVRAVGMALGFGLLFIGYGRYSSAALTGYSELSLEDFLVTQDFGGGREYYSSLLRRYPLTIPFLLSFEKLRELDVAERNSVEIERYRAQVEEEESRDNLRRARNYKEAALGARHTGNYKEAVALLKKALALSAPDDPFEVSEAINSLEEYLATARRLKSEATFLRNAGHFKEAHTRLGELLASYPNAPEASEIRLPVMVTSDPPGARVFVDSAPVRTGSDGFHINAETPFVLDLPPQETVEISVALDGCVPARARIQPPDQHSLHLTLSRQADLEAILPFAIAETPAIDAELIVVALKSGRIAGLDARTLAVEWIRELPELSEATATAALSDEYVIVPTSLRRIVLLDRKTGKSLGEIDLPGRPCTQPVLSAGRIAVSIDGGGLAVGDLKPGHHLDLVSLPTLVSCGPVSAGRGRFVVGSEGGKVWLCASGQSLTALPNPLPVTGSVTALAAGADLVLGGDEAGVLHAFDLASGGHLASVAALPGRRLETISFDSNHPVVGGGGALATVDLPHRKVVAGSEGVGRLAAGVGPHVAAAAPAGDIVILARTDLREIARFSADAAIDLPGSVVEGRGIFVARPAKILGIFCQSQ